MQKYIIIALSILVIVLSAGVGILYNDYSYLNELNKNDYKPGGLVERCQSCFRGENTKEDEKKINEEGIENSNTKNQGVMKKFEDVFGNYKISFDYPSEYYVGVKRDNDINQAGKELKEIIVFDKNYSISNPSLVLFSIKSEPYRPSYNSDEQEKEVENDREEFIGQTKFKFDYFFAGDGGESDGGGEGNLLASLASDLWISIPFAGSFIYYDCNPKLNECINTSNIYDHYYLCLIDPECNETAKNSVLIEYDYNSKEKIEKSFEVLKTFKWEKI